MTTDNNDNKQIALRWNQTWNTSDVNRIDQVTDEIMAPDVIFHLQDAAVPDLAPMSGVAALKEWTHGVLNGTPDIHIAIEDLFGEGDKVALRYAVHGTNVLTGKAVAFPALSIIRFADGKIAEIWLQGNSNPAP